MALLCLVLLLSGCRLDLTADAEVAADGSGTAAIEAAFDPAMLEELDRLGVDPTAELEAVAAVTDGWEVTRTLQDDGSLTVRLEREVDDAAALGDAYRELSAGLGDVDPALLVDVEVAVDADGASTVEGTATLRAPESAGITLDDEPVGPTEEELSDLVDSSVHTELAVTLPGSIADHDGDRVESRTVYWQLAPDTPREISASSEAPTWWSQLPPAALLAGGIGLVVLLIGAGVAWWLHRRRMARAA